MTALKDILLETNITFKQLYQFDGGSGGINLSYHYKDKTFGDIFNNERFAVPDVEYFNLNATYEPDNADWYVNVWARNILDKRQLAIKITANSLYGQAGAKTSTFYDKDIAASTTAVSYTHLTLPTNREV